MAVSEADLANTEHQLRMYLGLYRSRIGYDDDIKKTRANVFKACYYALTGEGRLVHELFPAVSSSDLDALRDYLWNPQVVESMPFYKNTTPRAFSHAAGQACARILLGKDALFRCTDCFYDESCVLCEDCYNPADHVGHNVMKYELLGGGMCDCGDASAFVRPLNCRCLQSAADAVVSPELDVRLRAVVAVALDYFLDVANNAVLTLPLIYDRLAAAHDGTVLFDVLEHCALPEDVYGPEDCFRRHEPQPWHLVMWNRNTFDYMDRLGEIADAIGLPLLKARTLFNAVVRNGAGVILRATDPAALMPPKRRLDELGYVTTIVPARYSARDDIVTCLLGWLEDVCSADWHFALKIRAKKHVAERMLAPAPRQQPCRALQLFHDAFANASMVLLQRALYNGVLHQYAVRADIGTVGVNLDHLAANFTVTELLAPQSRVQRLLAFEMRFAAATRAKLDNLVILALMHDASYKNAFSAQFLDALPTLLFLMALADRQIEESCIYTVSVQVFMCPPTNNMVVHGTRLANVFAPILSLISAHLSILNAAGFRNIAELAARPPAMPNTYKTVKLAVETVIRIFGKNDASDMLNSVLARDNLVLFALFQTLIQGLGAVRRKTGAHVEREDLAQFHFVVKTAIPILNLIKAANRAVSVAPADVRAALALVLHIMVRVPESSAPRTPVSEGAVSFINPAAFLVGVLVRRLRVDAAGDLLQQHAPRVAEVVDYALQSIVLAAQVKIGTWVRNGEVLARMASYYAGPVMADISYYNDFHMMQIGALVNPPSDVFAQLVHRWELAGWLYGDVPHTATVYEDKFGFACEQFIIFLFNILTERFFFDNADPAAQETYVACNTLRYSLADGPKLFSVLWLQAPPHGVSLETFSELLVACADYTPPQGLTDSGVYRLKDHLYELTDPICLFLDSGSSQSTFMLLVDKIAKVRGIKPAQVCLVPQCRASEIAFVNENLGNFLRTEDFAKFACQLLHVGLADKDDGILAPLLHLLHALVLDDERLFGAHHFNRTFLAYGMGDKLFAVAEASVSPHVATKAAFLLDTLIAKDDCVLEALCVTYGELHVRNYREKRDSSDKKRKRSKDASEARKAKILSKFAKQQKTFMKNNDLDDRAGVAEASPRAKCVACGEHEHIDEKFGVPIALTSSSIAWYVPEKDSPYFRLAFKDYWDRAEPESVAGIVPTSETRSHDETEPRATHMRYELELDLTDDESDDDDDADVLPTVASALPASTLSSHTPTFRCSAIFPESHKAAVCLPFTCSHAIHQKCGMRSLINDQFVCPLCGQKFAKIMPTYYYGCDTFVPAHWLTGAPHARGYEELTASLHLAKNEDLLHTVLHSDYFADGRVRDSVLRPSFSTFQLPSIGLYSLFDSLAKITDLLANTIRSHEMAARVDGERGMGHFVAAFPSAAVTLCRSLVQSRVLLFYEESQQNSPMKLKEVLERFYRFDGNKRSVFEEMVMLLFQTNESLQTIFRAGLAKLVAQTLHSFYTDYMPFPVLEHAVMPAIADLFCAFERRFFPGLPVGRDPQMSASIYAALEKCVVPYLRHCVLLWHVLTCTKTGDNEYVAKDALDAVADYDRTWSPTKYVTCLCGVLGIPSLESIIVRGADYPATANPTSQENPTKGNNPADFEHLIIDDLARDYVNESISSESIEYPNTQRLVDLPLGYQEARCFDKYKFTLSLMCLHCGEHVKTKDCALHRKACSSMSIFYGLRVNSFFVAFAQSRKAYDASLPGPYMTEHGEVKHDRVPGGATLNEARYAYLNKLWLNNELYGVASRLNRDHDDEILQFTDVEADVEADEDGIAGLRIWNRVVDDQ